MTTNILINSLDIPEKFNSLALMHINPNHLTSNSTFIWFGGT